MVRSKILILSAMALIAITTPAFAQCEWRPERPVTVVIPWGAGGGTDTNTRALAAQLEVYFGVPFNAENRTGGNGVVGHTAIATAPADGYTIGAATVEITTMHHLGLTPLNQSNITPIALIDQAAAGVYVTADSKIDSLRTLLSIAKSDPGKLTGSGTSQGGIWHLALAGMLVSNDLPADAVRWIPSEGAAPALQELIAGGVDVATPALTEGRALYEAGELKPLAVMSAARNPAMPDVPTLSEAGGGDWQLSAFVTLSGPQGMPEEIACSYEKAVGEILASEDWAAFKDSRGQQVVSMSASDLSAMLDASSAGLGDAMRAIGLIDE